MTTFAAIDNQVSTGFTDRLTLAGKRYRNIPC